MIPDIMPLKRKINSINAVRCKRYRKNKANKTDCKDNGKTFTASSNINLQGENDLNKEKAIFDCMKYLNRTHKGHNSHCACVCVVCDSFIVGTDPIRWLSEEMLQYKESYLSVGYLESVVQKRSL